MSKLFFIFFATLLLIYLILPGPTNINDFPPLPNSTKSNLDGDVWQVPNVAGYFSNNYRNYATNFYRDGYWKKTWLPFPPLRLNHPPEYAFTAIKVQTLSTYLEEYTYPLRDSLFVNGLEPLDSKGEPRYNGAIRFDYEGGTYDTKVTIRYYPSSFIAKIINWILICASVFFIWKLGRRVLSHG